MKSEIEYLRDKLTTVEDAVDILSGKKYAFKYIKSDSYGSQFIDAGNEVVIFDQKVYGDGVVNSAYVCPVGMFNILT